MIRSTTIGSIERLAHFTRKLGKANIEILRMQLMPLKRWHRGS